MSLIEATRPLLGNHTHTVTVEISAHPSDANKMVVVLKPVTQALPKEASAELKQLIAGLAMPIKAIGHPDEIEVEIEQAIATAAPRRDEWERRADAIDTAAETARNTSETNNTASAQTQTKASTASEGAGAEATAAQDEQASTDAADELGSL